MKMEMLELEADSPSQTLSVEGDDGYSSGEHILANFSRTTPTNGVGGYMLDILLMGQMRPEELFVQWGAYLYIWVHMIVNNY